MKSNKGKKHNIKYAPFIIFSTVFILIVVFSLKGVIRVYRLRSEQLAVRKNIAEIKKKNEKMLNALESKIKKKINIKMQDGFYPEYFEIL